MQPEKSTDSPDLSPKLKEMTAGLEGRYRIEELLGEGGMSVVFKATDLDLGRTVAVKLLIIASQNQKELLARFSIEAKTLAMLDHANIVKLLSWGITESGAPYHVLEYLEGQTLSSYLQKRGTMAGEAFIACFSQIISALNHAHKHGVIHRDIKPSNIILVRGAESSVPLVKIIDFGIARLAEAQNENSVKLTKTNVILGSPAYMSPELCRSQEAAAPSDLYSLACVMYEALSGSPPFNGDNEIELMYRHVNADWHSMEKLFAESNQASESELKSLGRLIDNCLAKEPEKRPTIDELQIRFEEFASRQKDSLRLTVLPQTQKKSRGRAFVLTLFLLMLLAGAAYIASLAISKRNSSEQTAALDSSLKLAAQDKKKRLEKDLQDRVLRLKGKFNHETNREIKRDTAIAIIARSSELSELEAELGKKSEAQRTLAELLPYADLMDEPVLARAQLLRALARAQNRNQSPDESERTCMQILALLHSAGQDVSEDAADTRELYCEILISKSELQRLLIEIRQLIKIWLQLYRPDMSELSSRNYYAVQKDAKADRTMSFYRRIEALELKDGQQKLRKIQIYNELAEFLLQKKNAQAEILLGAASKLADGIPEKDEELVEASAKTASLMKLITSK